MSDPNLPPPSGEGEQPPGATPPSGPPPDQGGGTPPPPATPAPPGAGGAPPPAGGGYPQPAAQPYGGAAGGGSVVPQLDVGAAISYGWKKFTENVGPFILLVLAVFVVIVVLNIVQAVLTPSGGGFIALLWILFLAILIMVASMIVQAGVWRAGLAVTRGETPSLSMLTDTTNIGPYIITSIIVGVVAAVGFVLCIIPGIIWMIFAVFAPILALDKGMAPMEAVTTSINWVKERFGEVFLILLACWAVYIVGAILCGVGLLVSIPVALTAIVYTYRAFTGESVAA
jgi:hypothetical protein